MMSQPDLAFIGQVRQRKRHGTTRISMNAQIKCFDCVVTRKYTANLLKTHEKYNCTSHPFSMKGAGATGATAKLTPPRPWVLLICTRQGIRVVWAVE